MADPQAPVFSMSDLTGNLHKPRNPHNLRHSHRQGMPLRFP